MPRNARFTVYLEGPDSVEDDVVLDRLFEASCDDATFGTDHGQPFAEFDRDPEDIPPRPGYSHSSAMDAIMKAIEQIEDATALRAVRIELDRESVLMDAAQIASRTGRTRESIRLLIAGERGPGDFPAPAVPRDRNPLWRWSDVAAWLQEQGLIEKGRLYYESTLERWVDGLNGALEWRRARHGQNTADFQLIRDNILEEAASA